MKVKTFWKEWKWKLSGKSESENFHQSAVPGKSESENSEKFNSLDNDITFWMCQHTGGNTSSKINLYQKLEQNILPGIYLKKKLSVFFTFWKQFKEV